MSGMVAANTALGENQTAQSRCAETVFVLNKDDLEEILGKVVTQIMLLLRDRYLVLYNCRHES